MGVVFLEDDDAVNIQSAPRVSNELAPPHLVPARRPQRDGRDRRPVHLRRAPRQDPRAAGPAARARDQGRDHRAHVGRRGGLLRPRERHGAHLASREMSRLFENPLPLRETSRAPLSYERVGGRLFGRAQV